MPGHDQTSLRVHRRAWFGTILAVTALVVARPVHGQGEPAAAPARAREPIDLAARSVRYWQRGAEQWALLSGEAAVLQGVEGVRAQEIVVRVRPITGASSTAYRLDVYAENVVPLTGQPPRGSARSTFETDEAPKLTAYDSQSLFPLSGPPRDSWPLARSGFLKTARPATPRSRSAQKPAAVLATAPLAATATANIPPQAQASSSSSTPPDVPPPGVVELPEPERPGPGWQDPKPIQAIAPGPPEQVSAEVTRAQYVEKAPGPTAEPAQPVEGDLPPAVEAAPADAAGEDAPDDAPPRVAQEGGGMLPPVIEAPGAGDEVLPPANEAPALESAPTVPDVPDGPSGSGGPPADVAPLPAPGSETDPAPPAPPAERVPQTPEEKRAKEREDRRKADEYEKKFVPVAPGTQRITRISPRNGGPNFSYQELPVVNGLHTVVVRGGINIVTNMGKAQIDISADSAVIWRRAEQDGKAYTTGPNGEQIESAKAPMEIYLEGNVVLRQDERLVAGNGDQKTYRANQAYYDVVTDRFIGLETELDMFAPGLVAPAKVKSPRIDQFRALERAADGTWVYGLQQIRADKTMMTGSRFPTPGYRITSRSIDITRMRTLQKNPITGTDVAAEGDPNPPDDLTWRIDARQNVFWFGRIPGFYWPRVLLDAEDLEPPLRQFGFRTNNVFGQQALADFNGFRLIGVKKPKYIDLWNVDVDYLSARSKRFPALGTEIGWFGNDLINDLSDPYDRDKEKTPTFTKNYFGYLDLWGIEDYGKDILGPGPAIETKVPSLGKAGFSRGPGGPTPALTGIPAFTNPRGRVNARHMQSFVPEDDADHLYEELRAQLEVGFYSDRYFLEEYYKRLFDTGMDQETLAYVIRQKHNWAYSAWTEANLQSWQTETQWLPKLDFFQLGSSLLGDYISHFSHTGVDYANTHTASEVNNPNIFAFLPYDPISNTSGVLKAGRAYTNQEIDFKVNLGDVVRVVPYLQGQAVGWTNQIAGNEVGRVWGAYGIRADVSAYKVYPWAQSELFNVHGLNHKINFEADYRNAVSNVRLDQIGVQDDLDDNTYESVRRYFALTNYAGGILPEQYDPRHLILRRTLSPITGTTDVQATMETLHLGIHQRLQTKRGPDGKRRIIDYMIFDLDTTYFPNASRDNFGKPFGQNMYNWQWFIGDRTSITSYGWFEFWNITGNPIYKTNTNRNNNPFGLNMITTGVSLSRPPRGNIFLGYSIINTGPINTSAPLTTVSYWLSPKWYGSSSMMYDFGNRILLSASGSLTRIGADYLTSVGLTVDPQRQSYMFAFQVSPRLSPNLKLGSNAIAGFDARYAPTQ